MIKPDDIPDSMGEICEGKLWKHEISDVLNAAIDAGVVSMPCFVIKRDGGYLRNEGHRKIFVWAGKPPADHPRAENYKGQTV